MNYIELELRDDRSEQMGWGMQKTKCQDHLGC